MSLYCQVIPLLMILNFVGDFFMTTSYATASARAEMSELRRLKSLLPPELQSWVLVEGTTEVNPPCSAPKKSAETKSKSKWTW